MTKTHNVTDPALALIRIIEGNGYRVSVFHNPGSLYGTLAAFVEIHAVDDSVEPPDFHMARTFVAEHDDADFVCASALAQSVGIKI